MDKLNFTEKISFPLASTWLDKQHQLTEQLASIIADIAGDNCIVSGMEIDANNNVSDGSIVMGGELFLFTGGAMKPYIVVKSEKTQVSAKGDTYTPYERRWAEFSDTVEGSLFNLPLSGRYGFNRIKRLNKYNSAKSWQRIQPFDFGDGCTYTEAIAFFVVNYNVVTVHVKVVGLKATRSTGISIGFNPDDDDYLLPYMRGANESGYQQFKARSAAVTESGKTIAVEFRYNNRVYFILPSDFDSINGENVYFSTTLVNHNAE